MRFWLRVHGHTRTVCAGGDVNPSGLCVGERERGRASRSPNQCFDSKLGCCHASYAHRLGGELASTE
jgi:hypothetical protein